MYVILDDYDGNVVLKKHMHAAIHWIIRHIITFSERVSKIIEGIKILLDWSSQASQAVHGQLISRGGKQELPLHVGQWLH